jgi:hypothetical protein
MANCTEMTDKLTIEQIAEIVFERFDIDKIGVVSSVHKMPDFLKLKTTDPDIANSILSVLMKVERKAKLDSIVCHLQILNRLLLELVEQVQPQALIVEHLKLNQDISMTVLYWISVYDLDKTFIENKIENFDK